MTKKESNCIFSISTTNDNRLLAEKLASVEKRSRSKIYEIALLEYNSKKQNTSTPSPLNQ